MRILILIVFLSVSLILKGQDKIYFHSIEFSILLTYRPNNKLQVIESNKNIGVEYISYKFKKYQLPGLGFNYYIVRKLKKSFYLGIQAGINIRYLEKINDKNYQSYFSFPIEILSNNTLYQNNKKSIGFKIRGGYNFKHPKYKQFDGIGGITLGTEILFQKKSNKNYFKIGYTFFEEKYKSFYSFSKTFPTLKNETIKYSQMMHQINFGIGLMLN